MTIVWKNAVPVLPVKDVKEAVVFYQASLGFAPAFDMGNYAGIVRDGIEFHLDGSGAMSGPVAVRINVEGIDALHAAIPKAALNPDEPLETKPWGLRQFGVRDPGGNRITFAQAG
jgi:uncharacterized glyoxalase superfamily protein PhnB